MWRALFSNRIGEIRYLSWEWAFMRYAFAICVWMATWNTWNPLEIGIRNNYVVEDANGLPSLVDLSWLGQPVPTAILGILMVALLVLYLGNCWMLPVTGGLLLIHSLVGGIFSSPAGDHHATQVVGMVLLGQFGWYAWKRWRPRRFRREGLDSASGVIFWSQQMICAGYLVSAISKWVNSGGGLVPGWRWVEQLPNIAVQFEKNRLQVYYDLLQEPASSGLNAWLTAQITEHPWVAMLLLAPGFYLEFFAVAALMNRRAALLVGLALMALHGLIHLVMHLPFYYFQAVDLIFLVNLPFWLSCLFGKRESREALALR